MSQQLTPKDFALAAAQGVAIALNARGGEAKSEALRTVLPPRIICGIPPVIFEVQLTDVNGVISTGAVTEKQLKQPL